MMKFVNYLHIKTESSGSRLLSQIGLEIGLPGTGPIVDELLTEICANLTGTATNFRVVTDDFGGGTEDYTFTDCLISHIKASFDVSGAVTKQHDKIFSADPSIDVTVTAPASLAALFAILEMPMLGGGFDTQTGVDCVLEKEGKKDISKKDDMRAATCTTGFFTNTTDLPGGLQQPGFTLGTNLDLLVDKYCEATVKGGTGIIPYQFIDSTGTGPLPAIPSLGLPEGFSLALQYISGVADFQHDYYY